jgi:hypothetical protein
MLNGSEAMFEISKIGCSSSASSANRSKETDPGVLYLVPRVSEMNSRTKNGKRSGRKHRTSKSCRSFGTGNACNYEA